MSSTRKAKRRMRRWDRYFSRYRSCGPSCTYCSVLDDRIFVSPGMLRAYDIWVASGRRKRKDNR